MQNQGPLDDRIEREKVFYDCQYAGSAFGGKSPQDFYGLSIRGIYAGYRDFLIRNCENARILECGCGTGDFALDLARHGARVVGIDISPKAVEIAMNKAGTEGLALKVSFKVMDAEDLDFDDNSFDVVCGLGVIHHLNIQKAMDGILRVLRAQGKAVFAEPLGHNFFINMFRLLTPGRRTKDERPLRDRDIADMRRYFEHAEISYFFLSPLVLMPFVRIPGIRRLARSLEPLFERIDGFLFKFAFFRKNAWRVLIILSDPVK